MRYLILFAFFIPLVLRGQNAPEPAAIARQLKKSLNERHIEPRLIDDAFSRDVFDSFVNEIDSDKKYFTEVEFSQLAAFRELLDDQLNLDRWDFLPMVLTAYREKLVRAERIVTETCAVPTDLRMKAAVPSTDEFARDIPELTRRWQVRLAREVMEDLARGRTQHEDLTDSQYLAREEPASREKVKRINLRRIRKILNHPEGFASFVTTILFKKYAMAVDVHTVYMSTTEIENFISALSTNGYNFGVEFQENDHGELVVSGLLPGGPAWNSGQIRNGDVLEKVRWSGMEWIEAAGMPEHELDEVFIESNHATIEFSLRQQGGFSRIVSLKKEKVNQEDAVVRAFLLNGPRKIGYISLPDFYSNWGGKENSQSAADVAREIVKLKKENIEGLILDVRFNGGGSLAEAVAMTGIFIDGGPVGIERERGSEPVTLKDVNRGTVYDGPMVVMVNGLSASASEFLAAALQDYRRAIVVGGQTYGKGVGQEIYSLQPGRNGFEPPNTSQRWGYVAITTTRMYRINGKSVQSKGVQPDIDLPDMVALFNVHESASLFAMKPDSVSKKTYPQLLKPLPLDDLRTKSAFRVSQHTAFDGVNRYLSAVRRYLLDNPAYVQWQYISHRAKNLKCESASVQSKLEAATEIYTVEVPAFSQPRMQLDAYVEMLNKGWIANLSRDYLLEETFHIICDYIDTLDQP